MLSRIRAVSLTIPKLPLVLVLVALFLWLGRDLLVLELYSFLLEDPRVIYVLPVVLGAVAVGAALWYWFRRPVLPPDRLSPRLPPAGRVRPKSQEPPKKGAA